MKNPLATQLAERLDRGKEDAARLAADFEAVFGQPRYRSASQRRVLEHLEECASDDSNSYQFRQGKDGVAIIAAGIHVDGAKSILQVIRRQVSLAAERNKQRKSPQDE